MPKPDNHRRRLSTGRSRPAAAGLLAVLALALAACTSPEFSRRVSDTARFWGDHAAAAVMGDDPSND